MRSKFFALTLWAALAAGCATQQLRFDPWKGLPPESVSDLRQGVFAVPKEKLFDAAAATLDHEPYFHWTFDTLDKTNGLIVGSASLFREVQLRVVDQPEGKSRLAISVPRRALKTQAKIYVLKSDPSKHTAYEPEEAELSKYTVLAADTEIDPAYFYSFTYRVLNDRTQVPFSLRAYDDNEVQGQPPQQVGEPGTLPVTPAPQPEAAVTPAKTESPAAAAAEKLPPAHRE
jgi:hypothetical protein